jgi:hypothetical protein
MTRREDDEAEEDDEDQDSYRQANEVTRQLFDLPAHVDESGGQPKKLGMSPCTWLTVRACRAFQVLMVHHSSILRATDVTIGGCCIMHKKVQ